MDAGGGGSGGGGGGAAGVGIAALQQQQEVPQQQQEEQPQQPPVAPAGGGGFWRIMGRFRKQVQVLFAIVGLGLEIFALLVESRVFTNVSAKDIAICSVLIALNGLNFSIVSFYTLATMAGAQFLEVLRFLPVPYTQENPPRGPRLWGSTLPIVGFLFWAVSFTLAIVNVCLKYERDNGIPPIYSLVLSICELIHALLDCCGRERAYILSCDIRGDVYITPRQAHGVMMLDCPACGDHWCCAHQPPGQGQGQGADQGANPGHVVDVVRPRWVPVSPDRAAARGTRTAAHDLHEYHPPPVTHH